MLSPGGMSAQVHDSIGGVSWGYIWGMVGHGRRTEAFLGMVSWSHVGRAVPAADETHSPLAGMARPTRLAACSPA